MEEIAALKQKHVKIATAELKELMTKAIDSVTHITNNEDHKLKNENERKLVELVSELKEMKNNLCNENQVLERKNQELLKYLDSIKNLEVEKNRCLEKVESLKLQKNKLETSKSSLHDQQILEEGSRRLKLYEEFTRIRWSYHILNESIAGYVSNRVDYIHHFSYKKEEDKKHVTDQLWQEIYKSTNHKICSNACNDGTITKN
ncbi:hypothetical protein KM043_016795 [Ampulex compressa]|nr:hypothetical protein KM043_016795 [Ampulex compressa]